ncbi:MAG: molecular chaperone DnaK [Deltaproteobacteria bacterium]|jgi:DnaK suppressor protein|nr:molecular chaperone DnaK [Deltaproteobacteria bacterium]
MDPLAAAELEDLASDLRELRQALAAQLQSSDASARPVDLNQPIGRVSRVDAIQQQSMAKANRQAAQLRARQVEAALKRIEEGEYGACLSCGGEIGFRRLKARPEAGLCVGCQSRREGRGA